MEYRANLFAVRPFGYFVASLGGLLFFGFVGLGAYMEAVALIVISALAILRIRARRMVFSQARFRYDGWISTLDVPLNQILRVVPSDQVPRHPMLRSRGPNNYCIFMVDGTKHWVNLLLFSGPASREFHHKLIKKGGDEV